VRTFIQGSQIDRRNAIEGKFSVSDRVGGKRVALIDDSVIRANTMRRLVRRTREKGAKEVHVLSGSPPVRHECDLGVDIASRRELVAVDFANGRYMDRGVDEIAALIGADSVSYLSLDGLVEATGRGRHEWCTHCFNGEHPIFTSIDRK
jgi:amidophosphoribosyltransferase